MAPFGDDEIGMKSNDGQPSVGSGWSAAGDMETFNLDKQVSLAQEFGVAGIYTVAFSRTTKETGPAPIECEALIEWTVAGNTLRRKVEVIQGMSISGLANAVRVTCVDKTSTGLALPYRVGISVSKGVRAANQIQPFLRPSTLNLNPVLLLPNTSADFAVPVDSGINSVHVLVASPKIGAAAPAPIPNQAAHVYHIGSGIVPVLALYDPRDCQWVPLAPGTETIRVSNEDNALSMRFTVWLGVDG